ncbi:hypothetical protein V8J88_19585 [Massilia sp. W12]|uniref:hypothetical protein n=1 Tax=Massilia sp. W12 TaxID=3126507 RepID=UPI0030CE2FD7
MKGKYTVYALVVVLLTSVASWGKLFSSSSSGSSSGSSWSSRSSGGSWGGSTGGGHK